MRGRDRGRRRGRAGEDASASRAGRRPADRRQPERQSRARWALDGLGGRRRAPRAGLVPRRWCATSRRCGGSRSSPRDRDGAASSRGQDRAERVVSWRRHATERARAARVAHAVARVRSTSRAARATSSDVGARRRGASSVRSHVGRRADRARAVARAARVAVAVGAPPTRIGRRRRASAPRGTSGHRSARARARTVADLLLDSSCATRPAAALLRAPAASAIVAARRRRGATRTATMPLDGESYGERLGTDVELTAPQRRRRSVPRAARRQAHERLVDRAERAAEAQGGVLPLPCHSLRLNRRAVARAGRRRRRRSTERQLGVVVVAALVADRDARDAAGSSSTAASFSAAAVGGVATAAGERARGLCALPSDAPPRAPPAVGAPRRSAAASRMSSAALSPGGALPRQRQRVGVGERSDERDCRRVGRGEQPCAAVGSVTAKHTRPPTAWSERAPHRSAAPSRSRIGVQSAEGGAPPDDGRGGAGLAGAPEGAARRTTPNSMPAVTPLAAGVVQDRGFDAIARAHEAQSSARAARRRDCTGRREALRRSQPSHVTSPARFVVVIGILLSSCIVVVVVGSGRRRRRARADHGRRGRQRRPVATSACGQAVHGGSAVCSAGTRARAARRRPSVATASVDGTRTRPTRRQRLEHHDQNLGQVALQQRRRRARAGPSSRPVGSSRGGRDAAARVEENRAERRGARSCTAAEVGRRREPEERRWRRAAWRRRECTQYRFFQLRRPRSDEMPAPFLKSQPSHATAARSRSSAGSRPAVPKASTLRGAAAGRAGGGRGSPGGGGRRRGKCAPQLRRCSAAWSVIHRGGGTRGVCHRRRYCRRVALPRSRGDCADAPAPRRPAAEARFFMRWMTSASTNSGSEVTRFTRHARCNIVAAPSCNSRTFSALIVATTLRRAEHDRPSRLHLARAPRSQRTLRDKGVKSHSASVIGVLERRVSELAHAPTGRDTRRTRHAACKLASPRWLRAIRASPRPGRGQPQMAV